MRQLPTYLDRYPAKMVGHLAAELVRRYASNCTSLLDPFCGSGAILVAAKQLGVPVVGFDLNPYAVLLSGVKLHGFDAERAQKNLTSMVRLSERTGKTHSVSWSGKTYWFTEGTIRKYEQLRWAAQRMHLNKTREGRAVLLAFALSVRRCSRADQRSPKPFISRTARERRLGRHFDPVKEIDSLLRKLSELYGRPAHCRARVVLMDVLSAKVRVENVGRHSHVITSPPYLNAQDYFRNFKLELHLLEGLLPFAVEQVKERFVGTERGDLTAGLTADELLKHTKLVPELPAIAKVDSRLAAVVHRYLHDMSKCFDAIIPCLLDEGVFVIACGDNLVGGRAVTTWRVLNVLLKERGLVLFDKFGDEIDRRMVPPQRKGHKGLIKEEIISAFRLRAGARLPQSRC